MRGPTGCHWPSPGRAGRTTNGTGPGAANALAPTAAGAAADGGAAAVGALGGASGPVGPGAGSELRAEGAPPLGGAWWA